MHQGHNFTCKPRLGLLSQAIGSVSFARSELLLLSTLDRRVVTRLQGKAPKLDGFETSRDPALNIYSRSGQLYRLKPNLTSKGTS